MYLPEQAPKGATMDVTTRTEQAREGRQGRGDGRGTRRRPRAGRGDGLGGQGRAGRQVSITPLETKPEGSEGRRERRHGATFSRARGASPEGIPGEEARCRRGGRPPRGCPAGGGRGLSDARRKPRRRDVKRQARAPRRGARASTRTPRSLRLTYRPASPRITWSRISIPRSCPAATRRRVSATSSAEGSGSPDGCGWR